MIVGLAELRARYATAFHAYLMDQSESSLEAAYELGRQAVTLQVSVLDLATIHHAVLRSSLDERGEAMDLELVTRSGADFLLEGLSAFEMVQRGFWEATHVARLERAHAAQLRQLAAASLAVTSSLSFEGILQELAERARELLGARECVVSAQDPQLGMVEAKAVADTFGPGQQLDEGLAVRLTGRGKQPLGLIRLSDKLEGEFSDTDASILSQLALTASAAIENAQLYARERRIAETLQVRLLPGTLPEIPTVTLAARYVSGAIGTQVGGDWYDALVLPDDRIGIAVGDVVGRGAGAASVMGQVRTAFRAYAMEGVDANVVVTRLNGLMAVVDPGHFSTMIYLVLDRRSGFMQIVRAGHPPPLVLQLDGRTRYLEDGQGLPLGVEPGESYETTEADLAMGSVLVLYTDGLVERRGGLEEGMVALERSVREAPNDPESFCDDVLRKMVGPEPRDDVALLVLRLNGVDT